MFSLIVLFSVLAGVFCGDLCGPKEWYNDRTGECVACKICEEKSWEMAPCLEFADTMCVDLSQIARDLNLNSHKWHEMEGKESGVLVDEEKSGVKKSSFEAFENIYGKVMVTVLCLSFLTVAILLILYVSRYQNKSKSGDNYERKIRSRLFSRDRLNTTEFMNSLATLDRRQTLDHILANKKRQVYQPQLLREHSLADEVFVDLSGLPKDEHQYEELDHKKCLLQFKNED